MKHFKVTQRGANIGGFYLGQDGPEQFYGAGDKPFPQRLQDFLIERWNKGGEKTFTRAIYGLAAVSSGLVFSEVKDA